MQHFMTPDTRRKVARWINHPLTEFGIMCAIIASVMLVLYEFSIGPEHPRFDFIERVNDLFTYVFILELGLRFAVEQRKARFFTKYWLDILAVIPFFRSFRILRVFRLLRLFRFGVIFTRRLSRWAGVVNVIKAEYIVVAVSIVVVIVMGAFSMRVAEGKDNPAFATLESSIWFAVMTVIGGEPIGGDPKTSLGRVITATLMMGGLTVFAIFTGTISAVMVNSLKNLKFRAMELEDIQDHVVLCGWNRAGKLIIEELLHDRRFEHIVVISEDPELLQNPYFDAHVEQIFLITGDYTRVSVLHEAGIERASYAMLLADSSKKGRTSQDRDARTVLGAMLIEKLNKDIYTVVQLLNRDNETSLRQVGVEEIIVSDEYVGNIMATVAKNRGIVSVLDELLTSKYGHQFFKCPVPESMVGKTVAQVILDLKLLHDATLIGVDLGHGTTLADSISVNPPGDLELSATHQIIIAASKPLSS